MALLTQQKQHNQNLTLFITMSFELEQGVFKILQVKLLCVNSTLSANYQYLSFKYGLTEADWYINIDHLMGKVRKKCLYCIQSLFYVMY